jgi:hypothetical protein
MTQQKDVTKMFPAKAAGRIRKAVRLLETNGCILPEEAKELVRGLPGRVTRVYRGIPWTNYFCESSLKYWALRQHMNNTGRKGAEWTIEFYDHMYTPSEYVMGEYIPGNYIPNMVSRRMLAVSIPRGVHPNAVLNTKVMEIVNHDPRKLVAIRYAQCRMPSQWRNADLPVLV